MGMITAFANQKGGVGKTTSAVNLGAYLALSGKQVLLVDFDPQGNLSSSVGSSDSDGGIYELINRQVSADEVTRETPIQGLSIIPSGLNLTGASVELVNESGRESFLKEALAPLAERYDFIFIDSPPSLGILTLNSLVAADSVIIPLQCEYFAMEGLTQLLSSIKSVQRGMNPDLEILGIVFTMYDSRTRLAQDVVQEVIGYFGKTVFRTIIPRNVRLSEAPSHGVPVCLYDAECAGAKSYQKLADEVLSRTAGPVTAV
jgi:chromosome partitioning protein